jgi:hypothetical protein
MAHGIEKNDKSRERTIRRKLRPYGLSLRKAHIGYLRGFVITYGMVVVAGWNRGMILDEVETFVEELLEDNISSRQYTQS